MNLLQLISKNNLLKFSLVFITIFFISLNAQSEIPEKYKIESSLKKCKGTDYRKWNNCYGEYVFPRIEYKGEWKDGAFHGQGILQEAWGDIFIGNFVMNKAEGLGKQEIYKDGEIVGSFAGEFKNDFLNGQGYMEYEGCRYEGNFIDSKLNGEGQIICDNGYQAKGFFKDDYLNGEGYESWENGTNQSGEFKEGYLDGEGEINYADGSKEYGTFLEGALNGFGTTIWDTGTKYEGDWVKGTGVGEATITYAHGTYIGQTDKTTEHGKGTYTWEDGNFYSGEWVYGQRTGKGIFKWNNGDEYNGYFKNGTQDGKGEYLYASGNKFVGNYKNGIEEGEGVFTWIDGDKYEGNYVDGYRSGKGKYYFASGTVYEGEFINNKLEGLGKIVYSDGTQYVGEFKDGNEHGEGSIEYPNGDKYVGQFKDAYEHGQGKMVYADGTIYEGLWENGKEAEGKTTLAKFTTDEKYYALIIGNNNYEKLEDLDNAVNDAKDLEKVLREKYGFETTLLIDEKSDETENAIIKFTQNREKNDNILIYYAGHGELVKKQKRGYWLPTDAGPTQDSKWLSNNNIKDLISSSDAKHILLIVDSCFSGSLMRGSGDQKSIEKLTSKRIERLQAKKTRIVITSGGNEQVVDGIGASTNSVFAQPLIKYLKENTDVIQSIKLFQKVQSYVIDNADQTPNHSTIHGTGHDGGEFLFFPIS